VLRPPVFLAQEVGCSLGGSQVLLRALPAKPKGEVVTPLSLILGEQVDPAYRWFSVRDGNAPGRRLG
jgi:NAD-dependent oxidoreductase involved in siderophore biosynthesis